MKILLYACSLVVFIFSSCAQGKYGVVKSKGYYREHMPGALLVDENGMPQRQHDTTYLAFLEMNPARNVVWKQAWVNNQTYNVLTTIMTSPYIVGETDNDEQVTISATGTNQLVQLNLEKTEKQAMPEKYIAKTTANDILVEGESAGKKVYLTIKDLKFLRPIMYP